jgi:hypothetical protein
VKDKVGKIPRHEPEVVEATARKLYRGDNEKVSTTSIRSLKVTGVSITSRYDKADELEEMRAMILALPASLRKTVVSIFCDSKASCNYNVTVKNWDEDKARDIGRRIERVAFEYSKGHNGITVAADDDTILGHPTRRINLDPDWEFEPD